MFTPVPAVSLKYLVQTAGDQAIAGATAGMVLGIVRGIVSVHRNQLGDGYDVAAEGLTHVGNGVVLGLLGGIAASVAGVSVAAIAGRGILALAAPIVASTVVTGNAQERVDRLVRPWTEGLVRALRPTPARQVALVADPRLLRRRRFG